MPRPAQIDMIQLTQYIESNYGTEFGADAIRDAAGQAGYSYPTVAKRLECYKVGHGKWNLTVQEKLEQNYEAPAAMPAIEQNLIPTKDPNYCLLYTSPSPRD